MKKTVLNLLKKEKEKVEKRRKKLFYLLFESTPFLKVRQLNNDMDLILKDPSLKAKQKLKKMAKLETEIEQFEKEVKKKRNNGGKWTSELSELDTYLAELEVEIFIRGARKQCTEE